MKKNLQFIVVIFFVTLAFLIMLNDVKNNMPVAQQNSVELYNADDQSELATTDLQEDEE